MKMTKRNWDDYFIKIAHTLAERSTCDKLHVGAVIVKDKRIISTGYNGSLPGADHCDDIGHDFSVEKHCVRTVHAELNAILQAAKFGVATDGSTMYVTHTPCFPCFKHVVCAGISAIHYDVEYHFSDKIPEYLEQIGGCHNTTNKVIHLSKL